MMNDESSRVGCVCEGEEVESEQMAGSVFRDEERLDDDRHNMIENILEIVESMIDWHAAFFVLLISCFCISYL